jgi:hypothetical protein
MELTIQLALAGFSIAVLLVLRSQMRDMDALRWWVFAGCAALVAQACDGLGNANVWPAANAFLYFLALLAVVFVLALYFLGIIKLESSITVLTRRLALLSIAILLFSIALGRFATPAESATVMFAETSQLGLPILCAVVGAYVW